MTPGRILIGTSGYVYRDWRERFYPRTLPAREWLPFYAERFPTLELNNSFYRLPTSAMFRAWRKATREDYVFAVKASRFLTHITRLKDARQPLDLLLSRVRHLGPTLGPLLFQLPPTFHANVERLDGLLRALDRQRRVKRLRVVLEVRHPQPVTGPVTAGFVYVRRHGYGKVGSYPRRAIEADARAIRAWQHDGLDVYVYFNNDWKGFAIRNALTLAGVLGIRLDTGIGSRPARLVYRERSGRPVGRKKELKAA